MTDHEQTAYPSWPAFSFLIPQIALYVGAPAAIICACYYGLPLHVVVVFAVMLHLTGIGTTMGLHRLFCHRSFETVRPIEWGLFVLGAMTGQSSPFYWIATHRQHHRHSDRPGDPHSPHLGDGIRTGWWRRFWFAHQGWTFGLATYDPTAVRDLAKRPELARIDRHWYACYLLGLALPAGLCYLIGGTWYDALLGFLWGGLLRHAINHQGSFLINSLGHVWGTRAFDTGDQSRNNLLLGVLTMGEGWHNNHHAHPYSARHGFRWWQTDSTWCLVWLLERLGLAWNVKRPKLEVMDPPPRPRAVDEPAVAAPVASAAGL
jgi:stearoyl-CoA desaturase (delta-9 desaturase)